MEECGARDLRSRDDFREKFNKGLEFRLEMDAVSSNDRPVGVSFPARDHEDATPLLPSAKRARSTRILAGMLEVGSRSFLARTA